MSRAVEIGAYWLFAAGYVFLMHLMWINAFHGLR